MHPWIAEPAAPRFSTDRHAAISMAANNLETKWRERLGVDKMHFGLLAESLIRNEIPPPAPPATSAGLTREALADGHRPPAVVVNEMLVLSLSDHPGSP